MYRHALPPGFVLKTDKKKDTEKETISLEEFVEVERHKLKPPLTPVTPETFAAWKKARLDKKAAEHEAVEKAKAAQRAAGKMSGMTGKDMFEFGGELYADAEEEVEEEWDISRMLARYVSTSMSKLTEARGGRPTGGGRAISRCAWGRRGWRRRRRRERQDSHGWCGPGGCVGAVRLYRSRGY